MTLHEHKVLKIQQRIREGDAPAQDERAIEQGAAGCGVLQLGLIGLVLQAGQRFGERLHGGRVGL